MNNNVKIRIYQAHEHAGVQYNPGAEGVEIEVSKTDADFIKSIGIDQKPGVVLEAKAKPDASASNA